MSKYALVLAAAGIVGLGFGSDADGPVPRADDPVAHAGPAHQVLASPAPYVVGKPVATEPVTKNAVANVANDAVANEVVEEYCIRCHSERRQVGGWCWRASTSPKPRDGAPPSRR